MNDNRAPAPDVVGPAEARAILHVSRTRFNELVHAPTFPEPQKLQIGRAWDRAGVRAFQIARTQPRKRAIASLVTHYRRHGKLNAAARHAGVHATTARRWLRELEIPLPREK